MNCMEAQGKILDNRACAVPGTDRKGGVEDRTSNNEEE